ncbi:hypothetical protein J6590_095266 [Homalodisca vitripennis]|nr:hypothetical protein J6590_095266 [Homalodisca vitripennis]
MVTPLGLKVFLCFCYRPQNYNIFIALSDRQHCCKYYCDKSFLTSTDNELVQSVPDQNYVNDSQNFGGVYGYGFFGRNILFDMETQSGGLRNLCISHRVAASLCVRLHCTGCTDKLITDRSPGHVMFVVLAQVETSSLIWKPSPVVSGTCE